MAAELRTDPVHGPNILEPLEVLGMEAFTESSVMLRVRIKTVPIQQWNVGREFRRRIKLAFEARGIEFPSRPCHRATRRHRAGELDVEDVPAAEKV